MLKITNTAVVQICEVISDNFQVINKSGWHLFQVEVFKKSRYHKVYLGQWKEACAILRNRYLKTKN
jgi:hypothetical protein